MGQSETQLRKIREAYAFLDELGKLAAVADEGFVAKAGDYNFKLPENQVALLKEKFKIALDGLKASAATMPLICFLFLVFVVPSHARVTGQISTDADAWCVGPADKEVCADKDGNFIPTKTNTQNLGSTALKYNTIYGTTFSGALTGAASDNVLKAGDTMTGGLVIHGGEFRVGVSTIATSSGKVAIGTTTFTDTLNVVSPDSALQLTLGRVGQGRVRMGGATAGFRMDVDSLGQALLVSGVGAVTFSTFTKTYGSGSAHLCVTDAGLLFASEAACP